MSDPNVPARPTALVLDLNVEVDERFEADVDRQLLLQVIRTALEAEWIGGSIEVGVIVTDDQAIRTLNRDYRAVDAATDVLSFSQSDSPSENDHAFPTPPGAPRLLGDVIISGDRVRAQATEYGHSRRRELAYLAVHGLLHLLGHDHETAPDKERMRRAEEEALASIPREG